MKWLTLMQLLARRLFAANMADRQAAGYVLAEKLTSVLHPPYRFSEFGRLWLEDQDFFHFYETFPGFANYRSAERKYFLSQLVRLVRDLPGASAECGVYEGASSYLICRALQPLGKHHHLFDSFAGLSPPGPHDGSHWRAGKFSVTEARVLHNLREFPHLTSHAGWIPECFPAVANEIFCFVHIDVDLYQPTRDACAFFYPRLCRGGLLVCDDYGFSTCPGAFQAMNEFFAERPEPIIHVPTGQAFVVKG